VKVWLELREASGCDYKLVLTTGALHPELDRITREARARHDVLLLSAVSDATLAWLYRNACCLAFTSEMEGNFPTQIIEALELDCPIVTFEHPTIQAELGAGAALLESAPFADLGRFVERIRYVRRFRGRVLKKQRKLLGELRHKLSYEVFRDNVLQLDKNMRSECGGRSAVISAGLER
jgi:glycosyltransferase involved in cell wall biosynthesis